jgi:hypothetical protein
MSRKSNTEMMVGQAKCTHCSSKYINDVKTAAKRSYRRRFKTALRSASKYRGTSELDNIYVSPTVYGYLD